MKRITEEREIVVPSERGSIHAVLTCGASGSPECAGGYGEPDSGDKPLVIMCHGLMMNGNLNPIRDVSKSFAEAGYDTLRIDFRGSGRSSGDITDMTPVTEAADLADVIWHVTGHPEEFCCHSRYVLCGHSLGGLVSLLVASWLYGAEVAGLAEAMSGALPSDGERARMRSALAALVLLAPAVNIEQDSRAGRVAMVTFDPVDIPDYVEIWGSRLSRKYFIAARALDTFRTVSAYEGPACVLLGEQDRIVEMNLSEKINAALPQAELHIIPRGDHLFSRGIRLKAVGIALEFMSHLEN